MKIKKGIKGGNLSYLYINPYLVTYWWKVLFTRKIITPRKSFFDNPVKNGGLSKLISYYFGQGFKPVKLHH